MNDTMKACKQAAAALSALKAKKVQPIPKEWFDMYQYCEAAGLCKEASRKQLLELKKSNLIEEKTWPSLDARGRLFHKRIYRNL